MAIVNNEEKAISKNMNGNGFNKDDSPEEVEGLNNVKKEVKDVRFRKKHYSIFTIEQYQPSICYKVKGSKKNESGSDARTVFTEEDIRKVFDEMLAEMEKDEPCFIIYDLDGIPPLKNVAFSISKLELPKQLGIVTSVSVNTLNDDFTYEGVKKKCLESRKQ